MPLYQNLPPVLTSASQQSQQRSVAANLRATIGTVVRPQPPRNLIAQPGPQSALVTWNSPTAAKGQLGIVAWRVYVGNESKFLVQVAEPTRRVTVPLTDTTETMVYVSGVTQQGTESPKIALRITAGASTDPVPALPPRYELEPTGGGFLKTRVP